MESFQTGFVSTRQHWAGIKDTRVLTSSCLSTASHGLSSCTQVLYSSCKVSGMLLKCTKPVPLPHLCIWLFPQMLCPQILRGSTRYLLQFRFQLKGHLFKEAFCDHQLNPKKLPSSPPAVSFRRRKAAASPLLTRIHQPCKCSLVHH